MIEKQVFLEQLTPSHNEFKGRHWSFYYKKVFKPVYMELGFKIGMGTHNNLPRKIKITAHRHSKRHFDLGNFIAGTKPIPDTLKKMGWIKDDSPKWFSADYVQITVPKSQPEGTEIIIYRQQNG